MPVYNGEKTIQLALNSLLQQSYKNWICIVVNDGSTDGTKLLLNQLTDSRFKIIHLNKNVGRGAARQVALDNAEGDYLTYLDADDFYHEDKILKCVAKFNTNSQIVLVATKVATYDLNFNLNTIRGKEGQFAFSFGDPLFFMPVSCMIKLDLGKQIKYNPYLNASEDVDYFNNYLDGKEYKVIDEVLYFYNAFESVTYYKVLEYSKSEFKRIVSMRGRIKPITFIKQVTVAGIKYLIYVIGIPFVGVDFFMSRRGEKPSKNEKIEFANQLSK
jgi:glycosyltransferase involved in cell wall biosynthesis